MPCLRSQGKEQEMKKSRARAEIAAEISWAERTKVRSPKGSWQFYNGYIDGLNYALLVLSDSEGGRKGSDGKSHGEAEKTRQIGMENAMSEGFKED